MSELRFPYARLLGLVVVGLSIASLGCVGNSLSRSELPESPIALLYWESEEGRRRSEMLGLEEDESTPYAQRQGVADLGRINDMVQASSGGNADLRYPGRLVLLDPRSLELTEVPQAPPGARPLSWSPDRSRLLFETDRIGGKHRLFELEIETGDVKSVTGRKKNYIAGAFGPGRSVAFSSIAEGPGGALEALLWVGDGRSRPVPVARDVLVRQVAFAPDGSAIAYGYWPTDGVARAMLQIQAPEAGAEARVIGPGEEPVFSPDSEWVVYAAPKGPKGNEHRLMRARADGSGRTTIGRAVRSEKSPAVAPDGAFVIYVSKYNGLDRLFVKRFDGTGDRLLFDDGAVAWPVW